MSPQLIGWTESSTPSLAETPWPPVQLISASHHAYTYLLCSPCLLYCNLSLLFPLLSITDTVNRLFLTTETYGFENGSSHLPLESEELGVLQLPLTHHACPAALIHLAIPVLPADPALPPTCGAHNGASRSGWGLANASQRGMVASYVLWDLLLVYTLEYDNCLFLNSLGLLTSVQLLILKNIRSFPTLARFPPPQPQLWSRLVLPNSTNTLTLLLSCILNFLLR